MGIEPLKREEGASQLPFIPNQSEHNVHIFYIKTKDLAEWTKLIKYLNENGINAIFHYVPLHSSLAGKKYRKFVGEDIYTAKESDQLLRLPLYYGLDKKK